MEILQGFTKLNKNTKKARGFIRNFMRATAKNLNEIYCNYSDKKRNVFAYWLNFYSNLKTKDNWYIPTFNGDIFTIAFTINKGTQLAYITPTNNYIIDLI